VLSNVCTALELLAEQANHSDTAAVVLQERSVHANNKHDVNDVLLVLVVQMSRAKHLAHVIQVLVERNQQCNNNVHPSDHRVEANVGAVGFKVSDCPVRCKDDPQPHPRCALNLKKQ
jgi:hypothetical protein